MIIRSVLFAAIFVSAAGVSSAQSNNAMATYDFNRGGLGTVATSYGAARGAANLRFMRDMEALRKEGLAQQALDGGTLTPEHRAELQARLDRINAVYQARTSRPDGLTLNADGSRRH
jgi:hypothetical protein